MSKLIVPAPLWRRLMAAVYDGLLLLGLWLVAALLDVIGRDQLLDMARHTLWMQLFFFAVGLAFFGWFWVHGGQTLGMHAWRLRVRRVDGSALRWPIAAVRFSVMLATWMMVLAPTLLLIPRYAASPTVQPIALVCMLATIAAAVLMLTEARRRAPCDWLAGTEVVEIPKAAR
ncbi:MAG: RDD family protein [Panacagrimonas sp.]